MKRFIFVLIVLFLILNAAPVQSREKGRDDLVSVLTDLGVWYRVSETGEWVQLYSIEASQITAGDLDDDGIDDLIGVWSNGLWVKYSSSGRWHRLTTSLPVSIASGDMNGDGTDDLLGSWGSGVYYRDSRTGYWVKLYGISARLVTTGDIDGDGADDLLGIWVGLLDGVWVRYSYPAFSQWEQFLIESYPKCIAAGNME